MNDAASSTPPPLRWDELTGPVLKELFDSDPACVGLIPVGATEQHGPHLPTGTDTIIATALADALAADGAAIALPSLPIGASWWHGTSLGGTLALAGERVAELAVAEALWAANTGLRRVLFVNGHVGNSAPLWLACDRIRFERPNLRIGVLEWWKLTPGIAAAAVEDAEDWHAHRAETSLMLALRPDLVDMVAAKSADEPDRTEGLVFRYAVGQVSISGVTGYPSRASAAYGQELWTDIRTAGRDLIARARIEEPPLD
jgi:creatinine amidohydrolase